MQTSVIFFFILVLSSSFVESKPHIGHSGHGCVTVMYRAVKSYCGVVGHDERLHNRARQCCEQKQCEVHELMSKCGESVESIERF